MQQPVSWTIFDFKIFYLPSINIDIPYSGDFFFAKYIIGPNKILVWRWCVNVETTYKMHIIGPNKILVWRWCINIETTYKMHIIGPNKILVWRWCINIETTYKMHIIEYE
jgi:hypothetical protein